MPQTNRYEKQFLDALRDIFVGAKVGGESGYINLMRIKSRYYTEGMFPQLQKDINAACKPFEASFREELFDKLYDFFKRYFSESGSIYFRHTPQHHNIYEKVYTDDRDVILFWKTHMLYYVKTDRLFNSMDVDVDGTPFFFDVSQLEHKRANEKRELVYAFKGYQGGKVILAVAYSEKGRKTRSDDILRGLREKGIALDEEALERACRIFEKQSEVDYFINKNAKAFLKEQFDLWLYQYVFSGESDFNEKRLKQLQAIKGIAYKIIDFIAQFEDELVRVWNKPKFVLNSHYVITLDKITDPKLLQKLLAHEGMNAQVQEWQDLGMVEKGFNTGTLTEKNLAKEPLHSQYQFLPLDTRYFTDLELDILALFDDLDVALDGWLVHSENYQALNTLLPKFRGSVQCVYLDPPFNTAATEIIYENRFKQSSWLSLMDDRLTATVDLMTDESVICVAIDDFELIPLQSTLTAVLGEGTHLATVVVRSNPHGRAMAAGFSQNHEYALFFGRTPSSTVGRLPRDEKKRARYADTDKEGDFAWINFRKTGAASRRTDRPKLFYPIYVSQGGDIRISEMKWDGQKWIALEPARPDETIVLPVDSEKTERVWNLAWDSAREEFKPDLVAKLIDGHWQIYRKYRPNQTGALPSTWWDHAKYSATESGTKIIKDLFGERELFSYPKSIYLVEDSLRASNCHNSARVLDYFAGSGTTAHAVINLNREDGGKRKYLLVEMGEHFNTVMLPRVKKVVFSDKWKDGKAQEGKGVSHFAKYYKLEQYEDALRRASYGDAGMFTTLDAYNSYVFLRDLKMLDAIALDKEKNKVDIHLEKLYGGIDVAETLSCVTGKGIKRITPETVEFQDGTSASLSDPDWALIKPLVWW